ncbi:MAG: rRNA maturation RNase YbeY [SAR202 cluster bacterium]|nr:rRNA maturation RNase YbeY [SAR202 cluster bacterium]
MPARLVISLSSPPALRPLLRRTARAALHLAHPDPTSLSIAVVDDATIRRLNRDFRGEDKVTDVLSFSPTHSGPWQGDTTPTPTPDPTFPLLPDEGPPPLGEVVISLSQAQRQANRARHPIERELALLTIHGILHLLGHDHQTPTQKKKMWALQDQALKHLFKDLPAAK